MGTTDLRLSAWMSDKKLGYWGERITYQLIYASKISAVRKGRYDGLIRSALDFIEECRSEEGVVTKEAVRKAEELIGEISSDAKKYRILCAAHAHMDMNWMWRWDETVRIVLDTFRTMLDLLEEYPRFIFSQSQASVYAIVEKYEPEMLEEIRRRIKEGRWEVTASTWVEADKNLPDGESLARHILYTRKYLSCLLEVEENSLNIDFEPDTFGHSANVPEILAAGGVKYYYHCRGHEGKHLFRWKAPSGHSVLAYREPVWYNGAIDPYMASHVPEFCSEYGMDTMLKVYGVGDHGGGPTRRDIERIIDMGTWPVFPVIEFGSFREYFDLLAESAEQLPVVEGELNFIFTGCYTSQSRIKKANRAVEPAMKASETFNAFSALCGGTAYSSEAYASAWEKVMLNHFHDIIPGSGTADTREHALGLFQEAMAAASSRKHRALGSIAARIDMQGFEEPAGYLKDSTSESAGVGFGIRQFRMSQSGSVTGKQGIFCFANSLPVEREEGVEVIVWDFKGDPKRICFMDARGNRMVHQLLDQGYNNYWGHEYIKVLLMVRVPPCGYTICRMMENMDFRLQTPFVNDIWDVRTEKVEAFILENEFARIELSSWDGSILSFRDKKNDEELVDKGRPAGIFRLIEEEGKDFMSAWVVGKYLKITELTDHVRIRKITHASEELRQSVSVEISFGSSRLKAVISLDAGSPRLNYEVECDWRETGVPGKSIPQLSFRLPVGYPCEHYKYDIPFGVAARKGMELDVPANSWAAAVRGGAGKKSLMLVTDSKNGFRGGDNAISLTLLRSSYDPDPYPEIGVHQFGFALCTVDGGVNQELIGMAEKYKNPIEVLPCKPGRGSLPLAKSFMELESGSVCISAVKMAEGGETDRWLVLRAYETEGRDGQAVFRLFRPIRKAACLDINEKPLEASRPPVVHSDRLEVAVPAYGIVTLGIELEQEREEFS